MPQRMTAEDRHIQIINYLKSCEQPATALEIALHCELGKPATMMRLRELISEGRIEKTKRKVEGKKGRPQGAYFVKE